MGIRRQDINLQHLCQGTDPTFYRLRYPAVRGDGPVIIQKKILLIPAPHSLVSLSSSRFSLTAYIWSCSFRQFCFLAPEKTLFLCHFQYLPVPRA